MAEGTGSIGIQPRKPCCMMLMRKQEGPIREAEVGLSPKDPFPPAWPNSFKILQHLNASTGSSFQRHELMEGISSSECTVAFDGDKGHSQGHLLLYLGSVGPHIPTLWCASLHGKTFLFPVSEMALSHGVVRK